ncbi:MAG: hypothetical protein HRT98_04490 [Mycoplasmatales bacterium]|nr:hypothetical protein [Mycoplasmatales bacterium]
MQEIIAIIVLSVWNIVMALAYGLSLLIVNKTWKKEYQELLRMSGQYEKGWTLWYRKSEKLEQENEKLKQRIKELESES